MRTLLLLAALLALAPPAIAQADEAPEWPRGAHNPFGRSPIRVHLDLSNLTPESAGFAREIRGAFDYWAQGGNGALDWTPVFEEVADKAQADVVLWTTDSGRVGPYCGSQPGALGCARPFERPVGVEIVLRIGEDDAFQPYASIRHVTRHELGHALGLPHSDAPGDVMAAHAPAKLARQYRPGDFAAWAVGVTAVVLVLGAFVGFAVWGSRGGDAPPDELDPASSCRDGAPHEWAAQLTRKAGREWRLCRRCGGGLAIDPDAPLRPGGR